MAYSNIACSLLDERIATCTAANCDIWKCSSEGFRQAAAQALQMQPGQRRNAVMDDLKHLQTAQSSRKPNLYFDRNFPWKLSIAGTTVCENCYARCYAVSLYVLRRLKSRVREGDNVFVDGRKLHKKNQFGTAQSYADAEEEVDRFLDEIIETDAQEIPAMRKTVRKQMPTHALPVTLNKKMLYDRYKTFVGNRNRKLCYLRFVQRWKTHHAELTEATKKTAYCDVCFRYKNKRDLTDEDKAAWNNHQKLASDWRALYRCNLQRAQDGAVDMFCIDKAESLRAPKKASEQPSADYFKSGLRLTLNGVVDVAANETTVHVMNEAQTISKNGGGDADSDFVLSCLWDVLERRILRADVVIQADNCCGQNKNNFVLKFAAYLIEMNICARVSVNFMLVGHTKFNVDGIFGTVKNTLQRCDVYSEADVISKFSGDVQTTEMLVIAVAAPRWYLWRDFLQARYGTRPFRGILSKQQFFLVKNPASDDGVIITARSLPTEDFTPFDTLVGKRNYSAPETKEAAGIDAKRRCELEKFFPVYAATPFYDVVNALKSCAAV